MDDVAGAPGLGFGGVAEANAEQALGGIDDLGIERSRLERNVLAEAVGNDA
jgi:hypothetical protein